MSARFGEAQPAVDNSIEADVAFGRYEAGPVEWNERDLEYVS